MEIEPNSVNSLFSSTIHQHPNIYFTIDIEENGKLSFLDVCVSKKDDGILSHQAYRRPTHTDIYMPNRTITQHKNSQKSTNYIEPSLTKDRIQSPKTNFTEKRTRQKRHNQNNQ